MPSSNRDATNGKDPRGDQGIPSACVWSAPLGGMWTLHTLVRHSHISSLRSKRSVSENDYPFDDHDSVFKRLFACANVPFLSTLVPDRGNPVPINRWPINTNTQITNRQRMSCTSPWPLGPAVLPCAKICFTTAPSFANDPFIAAGDVYPPVTDSIVSDHSQQTSYVPSNQIRSIPGKNVAPDGQMGRQYREKYSVQVPGIYA